MVPVPDFILDCGFNVATLDFHGRREAAIFNAPRLKYISIKGIFEDPYSALDCDCHEDEDMRFPAPEFIVDEIISTDFPLEM